MSLVLRRVVRIAGALLAAALSCVDGARADVPPTITAVSVTPSDLHSGERVTATVLTNGDATSVVALVAKHVITIPRVKDGMFSGSAIVPHVPRFIHFRVSVTFVARGPQGRSDQQTTSVKVN